ncbi:MAG: Gfo/Idh/MocA family oxidoreductase [Bacteroidales bacterium]|nr:Gfo/Idh/MocA family oxidoreductase [Bacteroidales bacterium]
MLKIGVIGAGHLGKIHIKCIQNISDFDLIGFYDPNKENADKVESDFGIKQYDSIDALIEDVDVVDIVSPTISHFDNAAKALRKFKHVFIEKPIVATPEESRKLSAIAQEAQVKVQVGHVERFNPAFVAAEPFIENPMFIEAHRLAQFNPRGTDVPVVLDLMIHDIDIILSVVKSNIRRISASGVSIVSDSPDIANARIEFDNGCVANLTASRISLKNMRKARFFQQSAYVSVDFLNKESEILNINHHAHGTELNPLSMTLDLGEEKGVKEILFNRPEIKQNNAIQTELQTFAQSILNNSTPIVTIDDGHQALEVAYQILEKIKN